MRLTSSPLRGSVRIAALALSISLSVSVGSTNDKQSEERAQAILKKAADVTNIEAQGAQPFLLVARTSWTQFGKTTEGQFAQAWQAPSRFRRETTLPGFIEAVVAAGDVLYRTRNADFIPLGAIRPVALLQVSAQVAHLTTNHLRIEDPPSTSSIQCISAVTEFNRASVQHVVCVDPATGAPLSEQNKFSSGGISRITFTDYSSIGKKQIPLHIKYDDTAGVHGEFKVLKLNAVANFPDTTFQRPAQSIEQPWCAEPQVIDPSLRNQALDNWRKWTVWPNGYA